MRVGSRRGALGLRGRIVGAVLVTTVATLVVAAVALLGPLETGLKDAARKTLSKELGQSAAAAFRGSDPSALAYIGFGAPDPSLKTTDPASYQRERAQYASAQSTLNDLRQKLSGIQARTGASEVSLLGYPGVSGYGGEVLVKVPTDSDIAQADPYDDVATVFRAHTHRADYSFGTIDGTDYARVALPITAASGHWVVAIRKPIDEIPGAVHAVSKAFVYAALSGLALTVILAIPLAATIVRRLRRLRAAALQLAREGPGVEVPVDRARDEVGDLARTFATMQRQLQHQEEARRAFVATASHELRTPLTSLEGMLELVEEELRSGDVDPAETLSMVERARVQSRRLSRLAADLLDLSRIDAEVALRSEPVELGELSRAVLAEFELGTSEREIMTALEDDGGSVWALGDPGSVARILRILLDNAVRASPDGSEIRVELQSGPRVALSVCDVGPGVAEEDRDLIFERFQRGRAIGGQAGFGLGLAIGRELAGRMGGELVLDDGYTDGAMFTLRLPGARAPDHDAAVVG
jgi:signal transduction histidine kinase